MLFAFSCQEVFQATNDVRLTLKLPHDIQKPVVNLWFFPKPVLDGIRVDEGVDEVKRSVIVAVWGNMVGWGPGRRFVHSWP